MNDLGTWWWSLRASRSISNSSSSIRSSPLLNLPGPYPWLMDFLCRCRAPKSWYIKICSRDIYIPAPPSLALLSWSRCRSKWYTCNQRSDTCVTAPPSHSVSFGSLEVSQRFKLSSITCCVTPTAALNCHEVIATSLLRISFEFPLEFTQIDLEPTGFNVNLPVF